MKVAAISDIHNRFDFEIPKCDLFIIAGDVLSIGSPQQLESFNTFLGSQRRQFRQCLLTPGNHDKVFETDLDDARATVSNATVLIDEPYEFDGLKLWLSPWTPTFMNGHFMADRGAAIRKYWDMIPEGLDVLVTHGPPYGILDLTDGRYSGKPSNVGCEELAKRLESMSRPPRYHIFGHIHNSAGEFRTAATVYLNVCHVDEDYKGRNLPVVFEIEPQSK